MNEFQDKQNSPADLQPGLWTTWRRNEVLGLFFMVLTGNFFFQFIIFSTVGNLFWPVAGGGILGVFLPLLLIARVRRLNPWRDLFLNLPPWQVMIAAALMAVTALVPTSLLAELSLRISPADPEAAAFMRENLPTSTGGIISAVLAVVIIAPLAEEIIFRGLLHRLASTVWGPLAATAVSSLVFGILHGEAWLLFGLIGVGVVLAFVFEATGSVTACWITHAVHNAISLTFMIQQGSEPLEPLPLTLTDWAWGGVSVLGMVMVGRYLLSCRPSSQDK